MNDIDFFYMFDAASKETFAATQQPGETVFYIRNVRNVTSWINLSQHVSLNVSMHGSEQLVELRT